MAKSFYSYIRDEWKNLDEGEIEEVQWRRLQRWRDQGAVEKIERPTRLDKARSQGYKAKQGVVVVRTRVRKGSARKEAPKMGRRSKRTGTVKITRSKSLQRIAEERTSRKYSNLEVLNSHWVGQDGSYKWFEVILLDPDHPAIENDSDLNWICNGSAQGRAYRGKTKAGKKGRGISEKGKGTEATRPSKK
ncbi:MAG: 50S ribosomal protein L15e [Halobacteria archaeon]